jgi:hypothetical protein
MEVDGMGEANGRAEEERKEETTNYKGGPVGPRFSIRSFRFHHKPGIQHIMKNLGLRVVQPTMVFPP